MNNVNEDREALEVIARLDERMNLEETDMDGRRQVVIHKGYASRYLFAIEKFVQDIEKGRKGSFIEETARYSGIKRIRELYFGKRYYRLVNEWLERYAEVYHYTARVEVFYDVCEELGLIGDRHPLAFDKPGDVVRSDGMRYMDLFDLLIEKIRERCQSRAFKERERLRKANARKNQANVLALEEAMFAEDTGRSRWLVLSLTLRYKPQCRRWITPEIIQQHRDRFFAARRCNTLMSGIVNYVWAIEQGEDTGLHLHVILFYSAEHNHDEHVAKQIGEYWTNVVTEGKGDYWNSNAAWLKRSYEKRGHGVGVGQINWKDTRKREALRKNLTYLAKSEQYLMLKSAERIRTFDMGQVPTKGKAGRPRIVPDMRNTICSCIEGGSSDEADATEAAIDVMSGDKAEQ
ncbi:inovirus Gp2 family protein [Burkholderia pseudomallei]|uniref:inovirus-type Gp2 protein n=2 Tax=Burkholderia pseudomallei TaxID=28450 RepID=UPI001A9F03B3|nr:inovirus-type Gp2 protein [Burkholderia pseudomallei]MBO3033522.1 inovirus-type Gp2 protein [Burkholderia pseudomallei]MBO3050745.1 inovirus-type Gp2 protein [Burkholderia pseudomallei]MBO7789560.1 inovirus-type Gp2 protein [Burkholderia pseudomallei]QTB37226.1 inovirus-type Gp2 protein [Burkholderia pseudomallei]